MIFNLFYNKCINYKGNTLAICSCHNEIATYLSAIFSLTLQKFHYVSHNSTSTTTPPFLCLCLPPCLPLSLSLYLFFYATFCLKIVELVE